jgi:hypothetical protein
MGASSAQAILTFWRWFSLVMTSPRRSRALPPRATTTLTVWFSCLFDVAPKAGFGHLAGGALMLLEMMTAKRMPLQSAMGAAVAQSQAR